MQSAVHLRGRGAFGASINLPGVEGDWRALEQRRLMVVQKSAINDSFIDELTEIPLGADKVPLPAILFAPAVLNLPAHGLSFLPEGEIRQDHGVACAAAPVHEAVGIGVDEPHATQESMQWKVWSVSGFLAGSRIVRGDKRTKINPVCTSQFDRGSLPAPFLIRQEYVRMIP